MAKTHFEVDLEKTKNIFIDIWEAMSSETKENIMFILSLPAFLFILWVILGLL